MANFLALFLENMIIVKCRDWINCFQIIYFCVQSLQVILWFAMKQTQVTGVRIHKSVQWSLLFIFCVVVGTENSLRGLKFQHEITD